MFTTFIFPRGNLQRVEIDDSRLLGTFKDYKTTDIGLAKEQRLIYVFEKRYGYIIAVVPQKEVKNVLKMWEQERMYFVGIEDRETEFIEHIAIITFQKRKKKVKAAHFKSDVSNYEIWSYSRIKYKDGSLEE